MKIDFSEYNILVVDDIPANVLLLKMMLEQTGFKVVTAESAEDAITRLNEETIDLILLDVLMPGIDGFELAKQLKDLPEYQDIPIIFLTALSAPSEVVKGFDMGANDFISKPFNKEELLVRVRHQLTLLEAKRTIQRQTVELKETIAGRDALYSVIAHDLRLPMASLKMTLNILSIKAKEQKGHSPEMMGTLQNANEISEQLFSLLDNLLKWTRSQLGKLEAVPQPICLAELTEGVIEVFSIVSETKKISIKFSSPPAQETEIFVDIDMIKTAIRNLLSNAIKFSHSGSEIHVVITTENDEVRLEVIDQGVGISEEDQCRLLDVGTHFTTFGTEHESGSGLGLLLVKEFMKLNNGKLFFHSKEGKGSTFGFTLPVYKEST